MHEEVLIFPRQLSKEKIGASFVESKALVLAHDPGLQLLVDVVSQSGQGRGTEATVVTDPPAKERIDVLGDFSQRPRRLPGNVQLLIVARMDLSAPGLTAGVYPQKNSVRCEFATRRGLN